MTKKFIKYCNKFNIRIDMIENLGFDNIKN